MSELSIREATHHDYKFILKMWRRLTMYLPNTHSQPFGDIQEDKRLPVLETVLKNTLDSGRSHILIAEHKIESRLEPIATLSVVLNTQLGFSKPDSAVLFNLWVDETFRRQGIAKRLVKLAQQWLKEQAVTSVQVGWHPDSTAEAFWRSLGFEQYEVIAAKKL